MVNNVSQDKFMHIVVLQLYAVLKDKSTNNSFLDFNNSFIDGASIIKIYVDQLFKTRNKNATELGTSIKKGL